MQVEQSEHDVLLTASPRAFPAIESLFERTRPLEVEIGCGKGTFLISRALAREDVNFLGVDVVWKWMKYGVRRSEKRGLANIRFAKTDARELVRFALPPESVSIFHVYFPDPWPKRRHRKRRLVTGEFLSRLHSRLVPGGLIELATDYEDYYLHMKQAIIQSGIRWARVAEAEERIFDRERRTNYEIKYAAAGRPLHYIELEKEDCE